MKLRTIADPVSVETLRALVRYDALTGTFTWLPRSRDLFKTQRGWAIWSAQNAGKAAFLSTAGRGYLCGSVLGQAYYAHRVAFAVSHGRWPEQQIDHINGDKRDNRLCNLREATNAQNHCNIGPITGRYRGVHWIKPDRKWAAQIRVGGKNKHLGRFECEAEAAKAYDAAAVRHHGEFARLNFPQEAQP